MMLNRLSLNRIGLNRIGLNRIGKSSGGSSDRPYIDPKVLDSLCGVWIMDQNTNESESRNIIKNKIADRGGDLELLNFGYKLNSGFGKYSADFESFDWTVGISQKQHNKATISLNGRLCNHAAIEVDEMKVNIIGNVTELIYWYIANPDDTARSEIRLTSGINTLPKSYAKDDGQTYNIGFAYISGDSEITIEQLPLYEGALVTDGKDDMIVSQKTVQEMLGGSKEITVVSMIHQIGRLATNTNLFTNCIQANTGSKGCNIVNYQTSLGKTGIYGYSRANVSVANNEVVINNILGDKADYLTNVSIGALTSNEKFSVVGYLDVSPQQVTSVAVYWTFIANKVLTTDEINQIIAYYKLDKYVTPQVIYDVKRQGLTNDTPAADWYLKDFSGNGHDMQLYNYAKKLDSGIGKYAEDFTSTDWNAYSNVIVSKDKITVNSLYDEAWFIYKSKNNRISPMKIKIVGIPANAVFMYRYCKNPSDIDATYINISEDGIYDLPESVDGNTFTVGFMVQRQFDWTHIEITQIPDYEGALVSDGKDDYGQFVGDLGLKDYTIAVDRAYVEGLGAQVPIISSIGTTVNTPFLMEHMGVEKILAPHSFGTYTALSTLNTDRFISYQSTYKYNGDNLTKGTSTDTGSGLTIGRFGANNSQYAKLALYSMLLFPYSLSEFLLERQLKKYKLGTLYPDMVEFRPVVSGNIPYDKIEISQGSTVLYNGTINKTGIYLQEGSTVRVYIMPNGIDEVSKITINGIEYTDLPINVNGYYYADFPITKSPQKISYVIDEYIRFEDIVQPYPCIVNIPKVDGGYYTYGDKIPVGYKFIRSSVNQLLPELYQILRIYLNGEPCDIGSEAIVSKNMVFTSNKRWLGTTDEPLCILSPQKLNIPNSSLKILGYVPDLTGKGNHGKLNNFAYTEDSGVAADGSIKFDGTDDHITIPTLAHGGKCVMMKVNWNKNNSMLYDQRVSYSTKFAVLINAGTIAYNQTNPLGVTYIDGIENTNILCDELKGITHNIVSANANPDNSKSPNIGVNLEGNGGFSDMSLYEFMLFPEIPSEDEIKKLNDVMGIEGGYVESPNYYWDAYGKKNTDTDRNLIADQVSKDVANALEVKNVAYNSESGYEGINNKKKFPNTDGAIVDSGWATDLTRVTFDKINDYKIRITNVNHNKALFWYVTLRTKAFYKITGVSSEKPILFGEDVNNSILVTADTDGIYEVDWKNNMSGTTYGNSCIMAGFTGDCNITIEQVAQYPNGLLLDGVEDNAVNTVIPAVTDYTWIMKREILGKKFCPVAYKGDGSTYLGGSMWFEQSGGGNGSCSFGSVFVGGLTFPKLISYQTKTSYNGTSINPGTDIDGTKLVIGARLDIQEYLDLVFYKAMLYTKTIDQLSINMLKNLFEKDELIDVTNPIFKKQ